jgi:hypothetical protein
MGTHYLSALKASTVLCVPYSNRAPGIPGTVDYTLYLYPWNLDSWITMLLYSHRNEKNLCAELDHSHSI